MTPRGAFALSPAVWGLAFALFVLATRNTMATDRDAVVFVVGVELLLTLVWFALTLVQFVLMIRALAKGQGRHALTSALWISLGVLLWFIGMGLGPALIYVT